MPVRTRVSNAIDLQLLADGVSRPGIDPRVWVSLAIVDAVNVQDGQGVFVDVTLIPSQNEETVRMGIPYAGDGFGSYAPVKEDDEVVVMFPSGDPNEGGVLISRLWSASDPPPSTAVNNPDDTLMQVEKDKNYRMIASGSGNIVATVEDGQVELGGEDSLQPVARKTDKVGDGTIVFAFGPGSGGATLSITYTPGDGGPVQTIPSGSGTLTINEAIQTGSSKVGAVD
jgi:Type VI secretion system/phage-baseplate injector OB domain